MYLVHIFVTLEVYYTVTRSNITAFLKLSNQKNRQNENKYEKMHNVRQIKNILLFSVVISRKFLWSWSLCQDRRTFKGQETADVPFCLSTSSQSPSRPAWSMATVFEVTTSFGTFCWNFFRDSIMQVADRPGDISILTHIFVSDNRTVVLDGPGAWPPCSWISALNHHT